MSENLLQSGVSNYADLNKQPNEDSALLAGSGQVPKLYYGIDSAYPSPTGTVDISGNITSADYQFLISSNPTREHEIGQPALIYENLFNNFSQDDKSTEVEDLSYFNPYIHYYPKQQVVSTNYTTSVINIPVIIQQLDFVPIQRAEVQTYQYSEPEETEE